MSLQFLLPGAIIFALYITLTCWNIFYSNKKQEEEQENNSSS
jgi:hypothetical protein